MILQTILFLTSPPKALLRSQSANSLWHCRHRWREIGKWCWDGKWQHVNCGNVGTCATHPRCQQLSDCVLVSTVHTLFKSMEQQIVAVIHDAQGNEVNTRLTANIIELESQLTSKDAIIKDPKRQLAQKSSAECDCDKVRPQLVDAFNAHIGLSQQVKVVEGQLAEVHKQIASLEDVNCALVSQIAPVISPDDAPSSDDADYSPLNTALISPVPLVSPLSLLTKASWQVTTTDHTLQQSVLSASRRVLSASHLVPVIILLKVKTFPTVSLTAIRPHQRLAQMIPSHHQLAWSELSLCLVTTLTFFTLATLSSDTSIQAKLIGICGPN